MPFLTKQSSPETAGGQDAAIRQLNGTLFILAIVEDEDDAVCLRADLNRSQLVNYKLQQCKSLEEGLSLVGACCFDLIILSISQRKDLGLATQQIRKSSYENPIIAFASNRVLKEYAGNKPQGIDELLKIEDLNSSLLEQAIRGTTERFQILQARDSMREQLEIAIDAGKLGLWTYLSKTLTLEFDSISATMFGFPQKPCIVSLDAALANIYSEDQTRVRETFEQLSIAPQEFKCEFRLPEDTMPLTRIALQGRFKEDSDIDGLIIIGAARQVEESNELYSRIVEANTEIQEALSSREDALHVANEKLRSLATELGLPINKTANPNEEKTVLKPKVKFHAPPEKRNEDAAPATTKITPASQSEEKKANEKTSQSSNSLTVDKKAAYKKVRDSMPIPDALDPQSPQEDFPFDFSRDPITDFSEPDPSKEGFVVAAQRIVSMTRRGHDIDVSISIGDQGTLDDESERDLLFSVLKELLTNVVQHSQASLCIISIFRDEDEWVLQVEDDGIGLEEKLKSVSSPLNQIGLFRIRTQLALKGGHLDMAPASPSGLVAKARLPVNFSSKASASK